MAYHASRRASQRAIRARQLYRRAGRWPKCHARIFLFCAAAVARVFARLATPTLAGPLSSDGAPQACHDYTAATTRRHKLVSCQAKITAQDILIISLRFRRHQHARMPVRHDYRPNDTLQLAADRGTIFQPLHINAYILAPPHFCVGCVTSRTAYRDLGQSPMPRAIICPGSGRIAMRFTCHYAFTHGEVSPG